MFVSTFNFDIMYGANEPIIAERQMKYSFVPLNLFISLITNYFLFKHSFVVELELYRSLTVPKKSIKNKPREGVDGSRFDVTNFIIF